MIELSDRPRIEDPVSSAVIAVKGSSDLLRRCLDALANQDLGQPYEVIVVDGWMDDDVAAVVNDYPFTCLVRSDENMLQGRGRNVGAEYVRTAYLAITDADCMPSSSWLRAARAALDRGYRLIGGPVLDALPESRVAVADNFSQFAEMPETRPEGPGDHFPSCNMALRREDLFAVGGFRYTGFPAGEDTLLCFRLAELYGAEALRFIPQMKVAHRGRERLSKFLEHQRMFGYVRGTFGIKLSERKRRLGRYRLMAGPIVLARMKYALGRTAAWAPHRLPTVLRISPLVLRGMWHWTRGFREACRQPLTPTESALSPREVGPGRSEASARLSVSEGSASEATTDARPAGSKPDSRSDSAAGSGSSGEASDVAGPDRESPSGIRGG